MTNPSTLYRGGLLHCPADPSATALLVRDGRIAWLGGDADAPVADRVVELDGALVTPAFVDAHVHATDTGLALSGLDLSAVRSAGELLDAVSAFAAGLPGDAVVLGHGWDDSTWARPVPPDAAELDRAAGGRKVYLSQASIHSALVSAALLAACPDAAAAAGYDASGWLRRDAHHVVRAAAFASVTRAQRVAAQRRALQHAASLGIAAVHECGGPEISDEEDFTGLLAISGAGVPEVYGYWGELLGAARARELGAVGAGGDLFADGALGSRTAHVSAAYLDGDGCGHGYVTAEQVRDHLLDCAAHGLQGGFHAIGDAAISTVLAGFTLAAEKVGVDRLRAARHRVEHAEIMNKRLIAGFVEFGIVASMQPAFDRLWGGAGRMYESRLGLDRSLESNPMGAMHSVGVALAFGSDSPVTPLDPWGSVRAAAAHHNPVQRMSVRAAFAAHTRGGWRAVHLDNEGVLALGAPATFAVWSTPAGVERGLPVLQAGDPELRGADDPTPLPVCRATVLRGDVIYQER
ncbi:MULTISPECIES: amidohydrolase [Micromonospora]|uniref:Amidohydrolase n=1 Tax=Micromonospora solifontis TaxID=2487138 RepID=A0ABX9WHP6_9ACTN|nr:MULTISPECIES: amidohydrolase family protein [Micromonospora]NES13596.1 amidohydrolase family protein [Micromonospora sp. PPF5-17B]NES37298.1 amidohydrolase family protein [Micromonospora solifontis]NES55438.1 amidohydrolase family protein [Micromonospora sp. PPF5-6]RNL98529.1 amidohydrolase [Micromonospora solifontis]